LTYWFNPQAKIKFESYEEYVKFRTKVEIAVARLGYRTFQEFLRDLFFALAETVPDNHVVESERRNFLVKLVERVLKR